MTDRTPQRESRVLLGILGLVFLCTCAALAGTIFLVSTQGNEIARNLETQFQPPTLPVRATANAIATHAGTAVAVRTEQAALPIVLADTFDSNASEWDIADYENEWMSNRERIANGVLRIESTPKRGYFASRTPRIKVLEDFDASVSVQNVSNTRDASVGILFRATDQDNFYWFGLSGGDTFFVERQRRGVWKTILPDTFSDLITPQSQNRLTVVGRGAHFDLFINDTFVNSFEDDDLPRGKIGLGFQVSALQNAIFEFDNVVVRAAPTQKELGGLWTATALAPTLAARAQWDLVLSDSFDQPDNPNGWYIGNVLSQRTTGSRKVTDGVYRWTLNAVLGNTWYSIPRKGRTESFYLAVDVHKPGGPPTSFQCAVFRFQDADNYYRFCINDNQEFKIGVRYKGVWTSIVNWTKTAALRSGEVNRLQVTGDKSHFIFAINGQFVWELEDYRLASGLAGVAIEMAKGDQTVFEFDNFELRGSAPATPTLPATRTPRPEQVKAAATIQALKATLTARDTLQVALVDSFDDNFNVWSVNDTLSKGQPTTAKIEGGEYVWTVQSAFDSSTWIAVPNVPASANFYASVRVRQKFGSDDISVGLALHYVDENNYYSFGVRRDGRYVFERTEKGQVNILAQGTVPSQPPMSERTLQALVEDNQFVLAVDGAVLVKLDDAAIPRGQAGLIVGANHGDVGAVQFDEFELRTP